MPTSVLSRFDCICLVVLLVDFLHATVKNMDRLCNGTTGSLLSNFILLLCIQITHCLSQVQTQLNYALHWASVIMTTSINGPWKKKQRTLIKMPQSQSMDVEVFH